MISIKCYPCTGEPGRLADVELHLDVPLDGLKLVGFAILEDADGNRRVTFPSRTYSVNGEKRNFVLLRTVDMESGAPEKLSASILEAFASHEAWLQAHQP